jgi:L-malate glycosyltransferase
MKILRLYTRLPPLLGGMENHIAQLSKEQIKLGHDVTIYFNKGAKVTSKDVQITKFPLYKVKPQFLGIVSFHFLAFLRLIVNQDKFDIVHIHGDWSSLIFSMLIKKIVGSKKLIMSIHDELSGNFLSKKALSVLLNQVDIIFATGHGLASQLKKLTSKKVIVQPSGIRNIFFEQHPRSFDKKSLQVIIVANLVKKKNLDLVLDIAKDLQLFNFILVGDGPEKKHFLNRIKYEGIGNIKILGYKNPSELHLLYYESDIFMLTSLKEGTPTATLEAMASGLPIVTSGAGGVESILGSHNYITDKNDKQHYIDCISELLEKADQMQEISNHNISISKSFSWVNVAKKIDNYILE